MDLMIRGGRDLKREIIIRKDSGIVFKNEGAFELSLPLSRAVGLSRLLLQAQSTPKKRANFGLNSFKR
jgi:hypothetical protein